MYSIFYAIFFLYLSLKAGNLNELVYQNCSASLPFAAYLYPPLGIRYFTSYIRPSPTIPQLKHQQMYKNLHLEITINPYSSNLTNYTIDTSKPPFRKNNPPIEPELYFDAEKKNEISTSYR